MANFDNTYVYKYDGEISTETLTFRGLGKKITYRFKHGGRIFSGTINLDLSKFQKSYTRAQWLLDSMVMDSMVPYMPMQTGTFINVTKAMSQSIAGSGKVVAAAPPMGRYLYEGKVMVDSVTGKGPSMIPVGPGGELVPRFRKGAKLKSTDRPLDYSKHGNPKVTDHWFETAKKYHGKAWIRKTKKTAGGG